MRRLLVVAALALGACAAPASFDGISGGAPVEATIAKEDSALEAPRPISPISVSLIASARPRLRWDLKTTTSNLSGAIVEMSRTRDFAKIEKSYPSAGAELVVPEDLALGIWFWRLKGSTAIGYGTATSATWEMLVRGPAAHGSSDMPTRGMFDLNGDGEPDLLVGGTTNSNLDGSSPSAPGDAAGSGSGSTRSAPAPSKQLTAPVTLYYPGNKDRGFVGYPEDGYQGDPEATPYDGPIAFGAGTDFDGDGFSDFVESGTYSSMIKGTRYFGAMINFSSQKSDYAIDYDHQLPIYLGTGGITTLPSVREGADTDGDGYGDAVVGLPDIGFLVLGTKGRNQLGPLMPIYPSGSGPASTSSSSRIAMGSFDANGDGLADVVFSLADSYEPTAPAFAAAGDRTQRLGAYRFLDVDVADTKLATAFAAGDFNGDGIDDIAVSTPVGTSSRVCLWYGHREKLLVKGTCISAPAGNLEFGASLTAADIEGDGIDELLLTTKVDGVAGVRVLRLDAKGNAVEAAPIGPAGFGVRLTTIWPGRPGKARWAAVGGDYSRIGVFEGTALKTTMLPPEDVVGGFGRGLR